MRLACAKRTPNTFAGEPNVSNIFGRMGEAMNDFLGTNDLPSKFPVGRVIVLASAVLLLVFCVLNAIGTQGHQLDWSMVMLGLFLGSELIWGSNWVRWVSGPWMILIFITWVFYGLQYIEFKQIQLLGALSAIIGVFGFGLIFHNQVAPYLKTRRGMVSLGQKKLKLVVRVVVVLGLVAAIAFDFRHLLPVLG